MSIVGILGDFGSHLRFAFLFLFGFLVLNSPASAATLVYEPARTQTVEWFYDGEWKSRQHDTLFLAGIREKYVAQAFFKLDGVDPASITSIVYRVFPEPSDARYVEYTKVYGAEGDPIPTRFPEDDASARARLYSELQPRVNVPPVFEFDLTEAIRTAGLDVTSPDGLRIDLTAYTVTQNGQFGEIIRLTRPELEVRVIPEPSTCLLLLGACGVLFWPGRVTLRGRR